MTQNVIAATNALPSLQVSGFVPATETTLYTCPASSSVQIDAASAGNDSGSTVEVRVSLVKSGGTGGTSNRAVIMKGAGILADGDSTTLSELEGHKLGPGDFISAIASAASRASLVISMTVLS